MKVANKYERIFSVAWCRIFQHIFSVNDLLELNTHTHKNSIDLLKIKLKKSYF